MEDSQKSRQPTPGTELSLKGDQTTAVDLCNRYLFTAAIGLILLEFVGCFLQGQIVQAGIPIKPRLTDIPLLFGLLIMTVGTFNFYKKLIEPVGESAGASLYSLLGMVAMASLPLLLFFEPLFPFRYLILSAYGVLVVIKNYQLRRRFVTTELGHYYARWESQATGQTLAAFNSGIIFYYLMEPYHRQQVFALLQRPTASLPPSINLIFSIAFLLVGFVLFLINERDLTGGGITQNMIDVREGNEVSEFQAHRGNSRTAIIVLELHQLLLHTFAWCYLIRVFSAVNGALFVYLLITRNGVSGGIAVLPAAATFCAIAAGFSLNDASDLREDRINNGARPVAKGTVTRQSAICIYGFCATLALVLSVLTHSVQGFVIVLLMLVLVTLYSLHVKRVWFLKNVAIAVTVTMMPVLAQSFVSSHGNLLLISGALFLWVWEKEILADVRDINGDQRAGIVTFAIRLGRDASAIAVVLMNIGCWICLLPILFKTVHVWKPIWLIALGLHTILVWYLAGKSPMYWVRMYLGAQAALTTVILFGFLI